MKARAERVVTARRDLAESHSDGRQTCAEPDYRRSVTDAAGAGPAVLVHKDAYDQQPHEREGVTVVAAGRAGCDRGRLKSEGTQRERT